MVPRGEHRRVLQHTKDECTLMMMTWYAAQVGEMAMLLCKKAERGDEKQVAVKR